MGYGVRVKHADGKHFASTCHSDAILMPYSCHTLKYGYSMASVWLQYGISLGSTCNPYDKDDGNSTGQLVLHSVDHIAHLREEVEILKLPQHAHSLLHHLVIPLRQRQIGDGVVGVGITVVLLFINLNRGIVSVAVAAHHLQIQLNRPFGDVPDPFIVVQRKGATRARVGEVGIIPGSQGTCSYIVEGLGNENSFLSCSHGAGRLMSRTEAQNTIDLQAEIAFLDAQNIVHGIRTRSDLDEAPSAYKNIDEVLAQESDLVKILTKLHPIAVIKG